MKLKGTSKEFKVVKITEDGYVCDGDGYVVLAANLDMLPRYSVVDTPFGRTGKVYDTGCSYGTLDVYVGW